MCRSIRADSVTLIFTRSDGEATSGPISPPLDGHLSQTPFFQPSTAPPPLSFPPHTCALNAHKTHFRSLRLLSRKKRLLANDSPANCLVRLHFAFCSFLLTHCIDCGVMKRRFDAIADLPVCTRLCALTLAGISKEVIFVAPAQIKMCSNNPIWDGLDSHSESTHIMTR